MTPEQKLLLSEAANALIEEHDAPDLYKKMIGVYEIARAGLPIQLTGRPAVLNPLLQLFLEDYPSAERVIHLVNRKRDDAGAPALGELGFDRAEYMRQLMANKRARETRFMKLWNDMRAEHDQIRGAARMEFMRIHSSRWLGVRDERQDALRARLGRRLTQVERSSVIKQLWGDVDAELDALEAFVQSELRKPIHQRSPNGFIFHLIPKKGST